MAIVLACASILFSTNSAMALSGLLCDRAMIRIAFQSSPIRNLPLSDSFDLVALVFATVTKNSAGWRKPGKNDHSLPAVTSYIEAFSCRARLTQQRPRNPNYMRLYIN